MNDLIKGIFSGLIVMLALLGIVFLVMQVESSADQWIGSDNKMAKNRLEMQENAGLYLVYLLKKECLKNKDSVVCKEFLPSFAHYQGVFEKYKY